MPILQLMVGPPGSGKSTFAKSIARSHAKYISQDEMGKQGHLDAFKEAIKNNQNILVDRMNFNKEQRNRYIAPAKAAGYEVRIQVFHQSYETCLKRCIDRIGQHETIVDEKGARSALQTFFTKYERPTPDEADKIHFRYPEVDPYKKVIICDLDGTLCNIDHRLHYVRKPEGVKKDWAGFFKEIPNDTPHDWCVDLLSSLSNRFEIVYCSGRSDNERKVTEEWLRKHNIASFPGMYNWIPLYMRNRHDQRNDSIVKELILDFEIKTRYNVYMVIDDRPSVCRMWRSRGLTVLQVNDKEF